MELFSQLKLIIYNALQISELDLPITQETVLIGSIPQFDSFAVVSIITTLEETFGIVVEDDEIDASVFETAGSLLTYLENKLK